MRNDGMDSEGQKPLLLLLFRTRWSLQHVPLSTSIYNHADSEHLFRINVNRFDINFFAFPHYSNMGVP